MHRSLHSVRLQVETLDQRDLPSSLLWVTPSIGFSGNQAQTVAAREAARRAQCATNLKQLGTVVQVSPVLRGPVIHLGQ
jgi:hypothetical protein